jgi:S1-C subfamily serine protease
MMGARRASPTLSGADAPGIGWFSPGMPRRAGFLFHEILTHSRQNIATFWVYTGNIHLHYSALDQTTGGKMGTRDRAESGGRRARGRGLGLVVCALLALVLILAVAGCTAGTTIGGTTATTGGAATGGTTATTAAGGATTSTTATSNATTATTSGGTAAGQTGTSPAVSVAAKAAPSVVNVRSSGTAATPGQGTEPYSGVGSGVIYSSDGYIVTNNHVVTNNGTPATSLTVTFNDGSTAPATIVGRDSFTDLAVIKVNKTGLPAATFAPSSSVVVGQYAIAIGSPSDYRNSVTMGIVSGLGRTLTGSGEPSLVDLIQTDAAISPGNSGGALLNEQTLVIGINVAYLPPASTGAELIGFAIPSDVVTSIVPQLISNGKASHPYLGVVYTSVTPDLQQQMNLSRSSGALVQQVVPGTPAAQAGVQQGDIITAIDGQPVAGGGDVIVQLRQKKVGDTISITLDRNGKEMTVQATLVERPASLL